MAKWFDLGTLALGEQSCIVSVYLGRPVLAWQRVSDRFELGFDSVRSLFLNTEYACCSLTADNNSGTWVRRVGAPSSPRHISRIGVGIGWRNLVQTKTKTGRAKESFSTPLSTSCRQWSLTAHPSCTKCSTANRITLSCARVTQTYRPPTRRTRPTCRNKFKK